MMYEGGYGSPMTPQEYYSEFVYANFYDFGEDRGNLRKAFNAAVSAFQLADHFYEYFDRHDPQVISQWKKDAGSRREEKKKLLQHLCNIEPAFRTVQSVATAYKHLYLAQAYYDTSSAGAGMSRSMLK